jgi:carbon starvation protein CstA
VAILTVGERESGGTPVGIFAMGASKFFGAVGIPQSLGVEFAMLAISTFLLTTLDTCTRLTRFLIEEFFDGETSGAVILEHWELFCLPALLVFQSFPGPDGSMQPVWKAIWPLFGATNQLLAAFALLTLVVFLRVRGNRLWICPMACGFDDFYAHACSGLDGLDKWFQFPDWRNIWSYVYSGLLPYHCFLAASPYRWKAGLRGIKTSEAKARSRVLSLRVGFHP